MFDAAGEYNLKREQEISKLQQELSELKASLHGKMVCACEREQGGDWRIKMCGAHEMEFEKRHGGLQTRERQATEARDKVFSQLHESNRLIDEIKKTALPFLEIMRGGWDRDHYDKMLGPLEAVLGLRDKRVNAEDLLVKSERREIRESDPDARFCVRCGIRVENTAHVYSCNGPGSWERPALQH